MPIKKETQYLIAAWNNNDPTTESGWMKHDFNSKRIKVDYLLGFRDANDGLVESESEAAFKYDMKLNNVTY